MCTDTLLDAELDAAHELACLELLVGDLAPFLPSVAQLFPLVKYLCVTFF